MDPTEKWELISKGLQEVLEEDRLKATLQERDLRVYWGTAITGKPHVAYFFPLKKIGDFLKAGCEVKILLANLHGYLDNQQLTWETIQHRAQYYMFCVREMLRSLDIPLEKLEFVRGTDFQLERDFTLDMYKMSTMVSIHDAQKSSSEVVKQSESPPVCGALYPMAQSLDEVYLNVDAQFGGEDQRKIFVLAHESLPKIGYERRGHLMNPMIPGLTGGKMSASEENSKIDLLDDEETVKHKLNKAYCEEGTVEDNGVLALVEHLIMPRKKSWRIERPEKYGGPLEFSSYEEVEEAFSKKELKPVDLKPAVAEEINVLLKPIRNAYESDETVQNALKEGYGA